MRTLILSVGLCLVACGGEPAEPAPAASKPQPRKAARAPADGRLVHFSVPGGGHATGRRRHTQSDLNRFDGVRTKIREQSRVQRNQENAMKALWDVHAAQHSAHLTKAVDANSDGNGEYLSLGELLGTCKVRGGDARFTDNGNVTARLGTSVNNACATYAGYIFQIWLPGRDSAWVSDATGSSASSEAQYRCYAWPIEFGESGKLAYFVDERGEIFASSNERTAYHGESNAPSPDAAIGELSDLHPDDRYLGSDRGWWGNVSFVPAGPPTPPK